MLSIKYTRERKAEKRKNWYRDIEQTGGGIAKEGTGKRAKRPQSRRWFRSHGTPLHNIKRIAIINSDGPWCLKITVQTYVRFSLFSPLPLPLSFLSSLGRRASTHSLITNRKKVRRCGPTFLPLLIKISSAVPRVEPHADACTESNYVRGHGGISAKHGAFPGRRTPLMDKLLNLALSLDSIYYARRTYFPSPTSFVAYFVAVS